MARTVYVPEAGGALDFADGTSDQQIIDFVRSKYAPAPAPAPAEAGIGALESGLYGTVARFEAAGGKAAQGFGIEWLAQDLFERSNANKEYAAKYKPDVADVSQISGVGDVAKFAGSTIAQSAPETAIGIGGAYAGAAAGAAVGSAVPLVGTVAGGIVGGIIGGAIAALPSFVGGNLQRQADEKGVSLSDASGYDATVGAMAQAPLDAAFDALIARKFPGAGVALDVVKKGFLKEVASTAAKGAVTEALTEPAQQAIEIAQANPEKLLEFGPDVQNELLTAAAGGALAGGVIGGVAEPVSGFFQGRAEAEQQAAKANLTSAVYTAASRGDEMKKYAEINTGIKNLSTKSAVGSLSLGKVRIEPTPANGLKAPVERFQIVDAKGNSIAEFGNAVNATEAVAQYNRLTGKKIVLKQANTGVTIPTVKPTLQTTVAPGAPTPTPTIETPPVSPVEAPRPNVYGDGLKTAKMFKTALGSEYAVFQDGSTTRFKTPHPGHDPADVGLKPKSEKTFYIRPEDTSNLDIVTAQGLPATPVIAEYKPGVVGVKYIDGPEAGKFIGGTLTKTFTQPQVGLTPVELWKEGRGFHFGNKIVEVSDPPITEPKLADPVAAPPVTPVVEEDVITPEDQQKVQQFIQTRKEQVATGVREALNRYNLKDVQTKFVPAFIDAMGKARPVEGSATVKGGKSFVTLATDIYDPSLTTEQMVDKVIDVLNHETIHSLFDLGLLRPQEKAVLLRAAETAKPPGKKYTYLDYAKVVYDPTKPGMEIYSNPENIAEEALAEMFRDWRKRNAGAPPNTRGLINRVIDALRHMFNIMRRNKYEDIFQGIEEGRFGDRKSSPGTGEEVKFSAAPALDSEEFKRWFRDSKTVDSDGTPTRFYHGTPFSFKEFGKGRSGGISGETGPFYFSTSPKYANQYAETKIYAGGDGSDVKKGGKMIPVFLSVKNPFDYENDDHVNQLMSVMGGNFPSTIAQIKRGEWKTIENKSVQKAIRDAGFDGFYLNEAGFKNLAVYKPEQVKSIFNDFQPGTAESPKYSTVPGEPLSDDIEDRATKVFGLYPYLRTASPRYYDHKRKILSGTNPGNADAQIAALDDLLAAHPNVLRNRNAAADYIADAMGKAASEGTGVPIIPYKAIDFANDPSLIARQIGSLSPGQLRMADDGLAGAKLLETAYRNGTATPVHTAKLILWGILSRGVSPFVQESMFLDVVRPIGLSNRTGMVQGGIDQFILDAVDGNFDVAAYRDYIKTLKIDGLPGAGTTHNLGAFGETTLTKLQQRLPDGRTILQYLHDQISDYSLSGKEIRRNFHRVNPGIGINNKVLSFVLLVSGREDLLVLDRVQMRNQFNDGRFDDYNLYDGVKIERPVTKRNGTVKTEAVTDTGSAIAPIGDGVFGLMYYEALERDLMPAVRAAYNALGRGNQFSMGRYHWESWVASSAQEVDHGSITGLTNEALGEQDPYGKVYTGEGKFNTFNSGMRYGYTKDGEAYVALPDGSGNYYFFTPQFAKKVVEGYTKKSAGIITADKFLVSESTEGAWYDRPEVNKSKLTQYLNAKVAEFNAERGRNPRQPVRAIGKADTNGTGPGPVHSVRRRFGVRQPPVTYPRGTEIPTYDTAIDVDDTQPAKLSMAPELPKLSVAPNYPFGAQVPGVNAAQINTTLDHITYGAAVDMMDRVMKSRTASAIIPERWRPSKQAYTSFLQKFADRMLPVGQMVDYIKQNGGTVPDALDAYMAEELMHGKVSDSLEARENEMYKPLMDFVNGGGIPMAELEDYLYAKHAKERNARIREINPNSDPSVGSGMSDEDADAILDAVARSPRRQQLEAAEQMVRGIIEDTNRLRVEAGLTPDFGTMQIEDEDGNLVSVPQYEFYVPLRGFADESRTEGEVDDDLRARIGRGFKIRGREDMRAFGRSSKASEIVAHAILQNTEAVIRAAKNKVGQSFLGLVEANPALAEQYGVEVMTRGKKPMKKYISSKGVVKTMVDPMYKNSDDVMVVKRNGEEIPIRIDNKFLQKALLSKKSGSPDMAEKAVNVLQRVNRFLAAMNTAYNPEFMLVNFPRDIQTAMVNITQYEIDGIQKKVLKDALPAAKAVYQMLRNPEAQNDWSDWYKMFREDGGKTSGFFGALTLDDRLRRLEKMAQDTSGQPSQRLKQSFDWIKTLLEDANGALENATRLSVYKNLVEAGLSRERAAQAAKNLTVNFDKRGEYGPFLNSLYLFYNASVQGTLSMMMAASRSKKVRKVIGGIVVVGVMQDMINSLMSDDDDDGKKIYDKIPDYKLETNMIIMDPFGITENGYYAIPLPYGFNAFYNMGRSISRNLRGEYKTSEALTSMGSTFIDAFNPIGGSPTVLDPVVALAINQDFTGRRIYPEPFPGSVPKADSQMYWSTTSPMFKSTADFLNWATGGTEYVPGMIDLSPDVMEYMYDYMLGGVGAFARRTYDTATNTIPALVSGDLQELEFNNVPFFRKLYGNVSTRVTFEDYFNKVNHVLARGEEMKSAIREGDPERIKSVRTMYKDELAIYGAVKTLSNRRNKLAGELRKVRENTKLPPDARRRRQELLQKQIETITNRVNKLYEDKIGNKYPALFS
jgi:hypothetical protein